MKHHARFPERGDNFGFTLIEAIGSLAIITLLASVVTISVFETVERAVRTAERRSLEVLAEGLSQYVERFHIIPGNAEWTAALAQTIEEPLTRIAVNERGNARRLLIDPNFWTTNSAALPYTQGPLGVARPLSPRLIILSSVGAPLPTGSVPFQPLWDWVEQGVLPAGAPWTTWQENESQLFCERVYLGDLFHQITLQDIDGAGQGRYRVNGQGEAENNNPVAPPSGLLNTFFLEGAELGLFAGTQATTLHIIREPQSFFFDRGAWRSIAIDRQAPVDPFLETVLSEFADWTLLYQYGFEHLLMNVKTDEFRVQIP